MAVWFLKLLCLSCCAGAWLWPRAGWAHAVGNSHLQLDVSQASLVGSWRVRAADLDPVLGLDQSGDRRVDAEEIGRAAPAVAEYLASRLEIVAAGAPCSTRASDVRLEGPDLIARVDARCGTLGARDGLELRYDLFFEHDSTHQGLLRLTRGEATHSAVFTHRDRVEVIAARSPSAWQAASGHLAEGIWHITFGYDHLAFLLTLLLPAVLKRRSSSLRVRGSGASQSWEPLGSAWDAWRRVLAIVTAFTLAHSITLTLAALGVVQPPERLIEVAIAASVLIAALDNLYPIVGPRSYLFAFAFGLVHGFGFANALGDLGLPKGHELLALLGFNLGVEVGQLAIVAAVLPISLALRQSRRYVPWVLRGGSATIAALALFWVFERSAFDPVVVAGDEAPPGRRVAAASQQLLARLAERWEAPTRVDGYQPFFRARIVEQILTPALIDALAELRASSGDAALEPANHLAGLDAALARLEHGDAALATVRLGAAATARTERDDRPGAAQAHAARGVLLALDDPDEAAKALELALTLDPSHTRAALWLATIDARRGRLERAEATLRELNRRAERAERIEGPAAAPSSRAVAADDERLRAHASGLLGDVLAFRKRWAEAEQALQVSLELHRAHGDDASAADDYRRLGDVTLALARAREALEHYEHAIDIGRSLGNASALAADYRNSAAIAQLLGDLPVAARQYRHAIEIDGSRDDRERVREDLVRLSQVYRQLDQFDEARECLERALALDEAAGSRDEQADDLAQLGNLHQLADRLDLAESFYTRALAISGVREPLRGDLHANLGNVHRRRGDSQRAAAMYQRALADYRQSGQTSKASRVAQYLEAPASGQREKN